MIRNWIVTFIFLLVLPVPGFAGPQDEFRVEGIMYENTDASRSAAIINGVVLKQGDTINQYKVQEVGPDFVRMVREETGEAIQLGVKAAPQEAKQAPPSSKAAALPRAEAAPPASAPEKKPDNIVDAMKGMLGGGFNPANMIGMANEVGVLAGLRQVYTAASAYYSMEEGPGGSGVTIEQLIKQDMISDLYGASYKGYRYRVDSANDGVEVYADPESQGPERKHFMIDRHGMVRFEKGKSATAKSQAYNI